MITGISKKWLSLFYTYCSILLHFFFFFPEIPGEYSPNTA